MFLVSTFVIYLSVTTVTFGDDTPNSTNRTSSCLNTPFTASLQSFEIPLNLHMEIPTESIVARVNDIIWITCQAKWGECPISTDYLTRCLRNSISLKERLICTYTANLPNLTCDPTPPYKHDMMTWTVRIDGKMWAVPPLSIDFAKNKTGLRCSCVGAHKQAHIDLPILPDVFMWVKGLFCQRNPRKQIQYTHNQTYINLWIWSNMYMCRFNSIY